MRKGLAVFVGGGLGSTARAFLMQRLSSWGSLPSTLLINIIGAFLLGSVYVLADEFGLLRAETRLFAAVGVLGGFTTFSEFAWGADVAVGNHRPVLALVYVLATVTGGFAAAVLGGTAGQGFVGMLHRTAPRALMPRLHVHYRKSNSKADLARIEMEDREGSA